MGKQACICSAGVREERKVTEESTVSSTCHFPQPSYLVKKFSCSQAEIRLSALTDRQKNLQYIRDKISREKKALDIIIHQSEKKSSVPHLVIELAMLGSNAWG